MKKKDGELFLEEEVFLIIHVSKLIGRRNWKAYIQRTKYTSVK